MALKIENVDNAVCDACHLRFLCYTNRNSICMLTNNLEKDDSEFSKLDREAIKKMHIMKAKKQGHYHVPQ